MTGSAINYFLHQLCPLISALQNNLSVLFAGWICITMSWSPVKEKYFLVASHGCEVLACLHAADASGWGSICTGILPVQPIACRKPQDTGSPGRKVLGHRRPCLKVVGTKADLLLRLACADETMSWHQRDNLIWHTFSLIQQLYRTVRQLYKTHD